MKKKSMLMLLAAVAATATLGAACNNAPAPEPECGHSNWSIKSNGDLHWSECDACGDKKDYGVHKDEKNNDTQADGADGKCDVCGATVPHVHSYSWHRDETKHWQECDNCDSDEVSVGLHILKDGHCETCGYVQQIKVTFDKQGLGKNEEVEIDYNHKVSKPADPSMDGYTFDGWFVDVEGETAFDFDSLLTEDVTVYAKWTAVETPGANADTAYELTLQATEVTHTFGELKTMYFKYTPDAEGRLNVSLFPGASQNCSFAFLSDPDTKYTGDADVTIDVDAGEPVIILMTYSDGFDTTAAVGLYLENKITEDLPDSWVDGEYVFGSSSFILDKVHKQVTFTKAGSTPLSFDYLGGKFDRMTFKSGYNTYTATLNGDGNVVVSQYGNIVGIYKPYDAEKLVEVSKFAGNYVPVDGTVQGAQVIGIDEDGNGYIKSGSTTTQYAVGQRGSQWISHSSTLCYGSNYYMTLNLDDSGNVESITVSYVSGSGYFIGNPCVYKREGDMIPTSLPVSTNELYTGTIYGLGEYYGDIRWGAYNATRCTVTGYDGETGMFTVTGNSAVAKIKVEVNGTDKVFKLYDGEDNLVDTLTLDNGPDLTHKLPATDGNVTVNASDVKLRYFYLAVETSGWYKFDCGEDKVKVYVADNYGTSLGEKVVITLGSDAIYLTDEQVVCFEYTDEVKNTVIGVTNTGEAGAPEGSVESKPVNITDVGNTVKSGAEEGKTYYYSFTAPKAGSYLVSVSDISGNYYTFKVNDGDPFTADSTHTYVSVTVTDVNTPVKIAVTANYNSSFTLKIEEDCSKGTQITVDGDGKGTFTESGVYVYADFGKVPYATNMVLGSKDGDEFEIVINGISSTRKTITLTPDQLEFGFSLNVGTDKSVPYAITYSAGAQQNPVKVTTVGAVKGSLDNAGQVKYYTFTAPEESDCIISIKNNDNNKPCFKIADTVYGYVYDAATDTYSVTNASYKLAKGQTVVLAVSCGNDKAKSSSFDLNIYYDFTDGVTTIDVDSFTKGDPTSDDAVAAYGTLSVAEGDHTYYIASTHGGTVTLSGYSAFTVVNGNNVTPASSSAGGMFTVTLPASEELYFKISVKKAVTLNVVVSYPVGTEANPYTPKIVDGVVEGTSVAANSVTAIKIPAYGTYVCSGTAAGVLWVNGKSYDKGDLVTINKDDIVTFSATYAGSVIFTLTVDSKLTYGKYTYDTDKSLKLSATTVVIGDETYKLTAMGTDDTYTFTKGSGDTLKTVVLTLTEDSKTYGGKELTYKPMFPAEAAQTYTGETTMFGWASYNTQLTITLTEGGILNMTAVGKVPISAKNVEVIDNEDGSYSFAYVRGSDNYETGTFTFGDKGVMNLTFSNTNIAAAIMTPENEWTPVIVEAPSIAEIAGTYTGTGTFLNSDANIVMTFGADGTGTFAYSGTAYGQQFGGTYNITVTKNGSKYEFVYNDDYNASFTYKKDGTLSLETDNIGSNIVMEKYVEPLFTEAQLGTYTGTATTDYGSINISLTLNQNNTGKFVFASTESDITVTKSGDTFSFTDSNDRTQTFTFGSDGKISMNGTSGFGDFTVTLTKKAVVTLKAGTYKGKSGSTDVSLVVQDNLTTATYTYGEDSYPVTISVSNGTYTFTYSGNWTVTFTVKDDGSLTGSDAGDPWNLTPSEGGTETPPAANVLEAGTYTGTIGESTITLTVSEDLTTVNYTYNNGSEDTSFSNLTLSESGGTYSFVYVDSGFDTDCSFTVNSNGNLVFTDSYIGNGILTSVAK